MPFEFVTVYLGSAPLMLFAEVAEALGHKSGASLDEAETWEAIDANARHGIQVCERLLAERKEIGE